MNVINGWIEGIQKIASPNFDERPTASRPSLVVIHCISLPPKEFGGEGINQLFTNQLVADEHPYYQEIHQLKVSSHLLIRRDGKLIQYVSFLDRAWHAGKSCYLSQENCNNFSIGIELEGCEEIPYTAEQYQQLSSVITLLLANYPTLSPEHITGHSDIAAGRKTDPGPSFNWDTLRSQLNPLENQS